MGSLSSFTQAELNSAILRNPLIIAPDKTVIEAIAQMSGTYTLCQISRTTDSEADGLDTENEIRASCVMVVEDNQLVGILTERDIVRLITQRQFLGELAISEVMTRSLITLPESEFTDFFFAVNLLQQYNIRHLPILDDRHHLVGLVTHESLQRMIRPLDLLRIQLVEEVMVKQVVAVEPQVTMRAIAALMAEHRVSSVVIVERRLGIDREIQEIPLGVVTERDIIQFQALNLDLNTCQVQEVMSTPIFSVKPTDSLWDVQQLMEQQLIRRLVVTGSQGELLGIITQSCLLQALSPLDLYRLTKTLEQKVLQLEHEKIELLENRTIALEQQVEERTMSLRTAVEKEHLVNEIASHIRSSLDLEDILNTAAEKIRDILECDRVALWQILPDEQIQVVAEATSSKVPAFLGMTIGNPCFAETCAEFYRAGKIRVVSDIYTTEMSACHREFLEGLQTRAKVLIPVIQEGYLWGLLEAAESHAPRSWQPEEISFLEQLATQLAVAIHQSTTHQQLQEELRERHQAEAALRQSEFKSRALLEAMPDLIVRVGADGVYREVITSPRYFDMVANDRDRVGCLVTDILPPDIAQNYLHYIPIALETGELQIYEQQIQAGDSLQEEEVRVIKSGDDEVMFLIRDISDRKQAERALQQINQDLEAQVAQRTQALLATEATSRATLEAIPDLLLRLRRDGSCLQSIMPDSHTHNFSLVSFHISEVLPPALVNIQLQTIEQAIRTKRLQVYEHQFFKQGRVVHEEVRIVAIDDEEVLAIVRDVSERKRYESALRESQRFLQTVLDTMPLSVFWKDRDSVYLGCNRNLLQDIGIQSSAELIGKTDHDLFFNSTMATNYREDDELIMKTNTSRIGSVEYMTKADGSQIWIESNKLPIHDLDGNVMGILGAYQDISDRKHAEAELQRTNQELARATRLKDEFLANMSHELRTPLNAIMGMTEGLQEEVFGDINEQQIKALQTIENSASHLLSLINDILDVAKIESGQIDLECSSVAIIPLCSSSLAFIKQQALQKRIQLETNLPPNLPHLLIDERRIRQVLINLLNNAVKFTLEGGRITLKVSPTPNREEVSGDHYLRIAISDTGIGISAENIDKLFQPFVQIDSALNRQYAGTGLGLALVKKIVELHGGKVGLTSKLGGGSCFTVDLPCDPATLSVSSPRIAIPSSAGVVLEDLDLRDTTSSASPLILLAEDNEANINTISSYLGAKGYQIVLAGNGQEAIAKAKSEHPDLILMDIQMPGMDGLEAMRQIRCDPTLVEVPIVALTALAMTGDRERCLEAGANDYLSKPIKLKELTLTIVQALNARKTHS